MPFAAIVGGGLSLLGASMQSDAAGHAADVQAEATKEANALQQKQYEQTRADLAPWRNVGGGAAYLLAQKLGIPMSPAASVDRNAIRAALLPQFTRTVQAAPIAPAPGGGYQGEGGESSGFGIGNGILAGYYAQQANQGQQAQQGPTTTVDEAGLQAAIEREVAAQSAGLQGTDPNAADFGSLLKPFAPSDLTTDPSYQFRKQEGMNGLERSAAARGGLLSGAQLKALNRYNSDLASQEYGNAYNRNASDRRMTYDFLSGQSTSGQNAAAGTASAGTAMAGQVGANTTAQGNALGAAAIAQGNALSGGIQNALTGYRQNQLISGANDQNALMRAVLGGNAGLDYDPSRTTGSGMPLWYTGG